jgi:hypothetical protein
MQGGQQFINLNKDLECAHKTGVMMHEIVDALGFHVRKQINLLIIAM